jgi:nucleotidyltransferase substrate binding protein (TIGR01987 family)
MAHDPDLRWKQRFQNFDRALTLLREALAKGPATLSDLEKEGTVQRFEFCLELAWKTAKDYLEHAGVKIEPITPRQVVKEAFAAKIIPDGQVWIDMLDHRNALSHTYDGRELDRAMEALLARYLPAFWQLHAFFRDKFEP